MIRNLKNSSKQKLCNVLFLLPACIVFAVFVLVPFLQGIPLSLYQWDGYSDTRTFVGLSNYLQVFKDPNITEVVGNTLFFTLLYLVGCNVIGLLLALLVKKTSKLNTVLRTIFFMPFVLSMILASFMFTYIYSDVFYALLGIKSFLGNVNYVNPAIAAIAIWKDSGYCMIIYIASLQMVPNEYYEAARIDGAENRQMFFRITLPNLKPMIFVVVVLALLNSFKVFREAYLVAGNYPNESMYLIQHLFNNWFRDLSLDKMAAASFLISIVLILLIFALRKAWDSKNEK